MALESQVANPEFSHLPYAIGIGGAVVGVVLALVVILQRRQRVRLASQVAERTRELSTANQALTSAMKEKDEFLAIVSHEFRTPLTVIFGVNELMKDLNTDSEVEDLLQRSNRNVARLRSLVSDILAVTQSDNAQLVGAPDDVAVSARIERVLDDLDATGIEFTGQPDLRITADPIHFDHVLTNLISNARKYGASPITISAARSGGDALVEVSDAGPGVDPESVPHLFERFSQGDGGSTRKSRGVGLGLHIAKTMVELANGSIEYTGGENGARFTVRYPLATASVHTDLSGVLD